LPNAFTRVPDRPVPPLPRWASALLPVADLFMVVMFSRPPTGTLRTTWVTPATEQLCVALAVVGFLGGGFLVWARGAGAWLGLALILLAAGCASVALVGLAQRRR
jgi:hypothetical protein